MAVSGGTSAARPKSMWVAVLARSGAVTLGVFLALALLEGALAVAGMSAAPAARPDARPVVGKRAPPTFPPEERRVLCTGDSNTFGLHLAQSDSYPAQLEALLRRSPHATWRVINAGVPARNSAEVRYHLAEQLERFRPEIVVVWVGINTSWSRRMGHLWALPDREAPPPPHAVFEELRIVRAARVLFDMPAPKDHERVPLIPGAITEHEFVTQPGKMARHDYSKGAGHDELVRRVSLDLTRVRALCDAAGAKLLVIDYPYEVPHIKNAINPAIAGFAERSGTPRVSLESDLLPELRRLGVDRHVFADLHLKELATADVARRVAARFVAEGWVEGGGWLEAPGLSERASALGLDIVGEPPHVRAVVTAPEGLPLQLIVEPLVLPRGGHIAGPVGRDEGEPQFHVDLGTARPAEWVLPAAPPAHVQALADRGAVRFFGWRLQARTFVDGAVVRSFSVYVTREGRAIDFPALGAPPRSSAGSRP